MFRSKQPQEIPPSYLLWLLKSPPYKQVIEAYDTKHGAVRANLTFDQLCRIQIPLLKGDAMKKFLKKQNAVDTAKRTLGSSQNSVVEYLKSVSGSNLLPIKAKDTIPAEDRTDEEIAHKRLDELRQSPDRTIKGAALERKMAQWTS